MPVHAQRLDDAVCADLRKEDVGHDSGEPDGENVHHPLGLLNLRHRAQLPPAAAWCAVLADLAIGYDRRLVQEPVPAIDRQTKS